MNTNPPSPLPRSKTAPLLALCLSGMAGLHRTLWLRMMLFLGLLLPCFGFISQDIHFASHPFELFMDFQYGLLRYLSLVFALIALRSIWRYEECSGIQTALRAAGVSPLKHLAAKHLAMFLLIAGYQAYLTLVAWLLSRIWLTDPSLSIVTIAHAQGNAAALLGSAWANTLMLSVVVFLIRLCWALTGQMLLGTIAGITLFLAGCIQPVWYSYFQHSENLPFVFRTFGALLNGLVPPFWQFDLWLLRHDNAPGTAMLPHLLYLTELAVFWTLLIHFASWGATYFKRP